MKHVVLDRGMQEQGTLVEEPRLLHEYFERQARRRPDHAAVECPDGTLSYRELDALADRVAAALRRRGVQAGSLAAVYMEKSCGLFAGLLGVLKAGGGYVPIDPKFPAERVESILEDADVRVVLTDAALAPTLNQVVSVELLIIEREFGEEAPAASPTPHPVVVTPCDPCYVIYTSGSTGRPKGVLIEHRNAINFVRSLRTVYKLDDRDRIYQGFSVAFDASVEEIWAAFSVGGTLVVPPSDVARSTFDAAEFIDSHAITYFSTVPSFLAMLKGDLPSVRLLVVGGEACPPELVNRFARPGRRMMNTYGPTETTVVATVTDCHAGEPVTIGTALPGYTTYVLDDALRPVAPGETGELYIGGESVARGYLNRPELTAESFLDNPFDAPPADRIYRTHDLVRLGTDGQLHFLGRADSQVKIRGFRIELSEIEAVLIEHPSLRAAAVNVVELGELKELAAYVVLEPEFSAPNHASIAELLRSRVPDYMVPRYLDVLDELPAMTSGKVDRKQLPLPRTIFGARTRSVVPAANELERVILEAWEDQFGMSPVSVEDDFFLDLRGHSLLASHAVTALRKRLNTLQLSVPDIYAHRTARALAAHLAGLGVTPDTLQSESRPTVELDYTATPLTWFRIPCAILQVFGLLLFYAVVSAPVVLLVVLALQIRSGSIDAFRAVDMATTFAFLVWPCWLLLSIAVKWIVIGRYKPGRYPVWGFYYFRWWLVSRFQTLSWSEMFVGSPLMTLYYRAMGAKIGKHCTIGTPLCTAFDLVTIGDNTSIGADTQLLGYRVENGWLILGPVSIGSDCYVGSHCCVGLNTTMHDGARLDDMSHLGDHSEIGAGRGMRGSPVEPATVDLHEGAPRRRGRAFAYGLLHLGLIYVMGYILAFSLAPGLALIGYAFATAGPAWGLAAVIAAAPLSMICFLVLVVAVKRIAIGEIVPGVHSLHSREYLKFWFLSYLLSNTRHLALALYATLFFPAFLRLLGARIGGSVEISTAMHIIPDLLDIDDGSFLADACIVGGHRIHDGAIEIRPTRIGKRTFIGNSAFVPAGIEIGNNGLIGVMSTPPSGVARTPDETRWLGSPGFELPNTQAFTCFGDMQTYQPSSGRVALRMAVELLRVFTPGIIASAALVLFGNAIVLAYFALPLSAVFMVAPCAALLVSIVSVGVVALLKTALMGEFTPTVKPLWCGYVWRNEIVNALYESVAAPAMMPLMGTPFIAPCLRMMGCRVGRWVFLETTLFSEFDLVEIGDRAALNLGSTIQTHLFEDRVMKADHLRIGAGCSVGNMAVVLYDTEMQQGSSLGPLSVLMKGEVLPASTAWAGIPTRPVQAPSIVPAQVSENAAVKTIDLQLASAMPHARRQKIRAQFLGSPSRLAMEHQMQRGAENLLNSIGRAPRRHGADARRRRGRANQSSIARRLARTPAVIFGGREEYR